MFFLLIITDVDESITRKRTGDSRGVECKEMQFCSPPAPLNIVFIRVCLKKPTFARSCHVNLPSPECLVQRLRLLLNSSHALVQVLIVVFDSSATFPPSDFHSCSSIF
jgi:hypothetical protein